MGDDNIVDRNDVERGDLLQRIGEAEKSSPVDDSRELNLLFDILQKNEKGVVHFPATSQEEKEISFPETKVEIEDTEELKLLMEILNQKHIPLEKIDEPKEVKSNVKDDSQETSLGKEIENDEIVNANENITNIATVSEKNIPDKSKIGEIRKTKVKKNKDDEKINKEKLRQEKLENKEKQKVLSLIPLL